MPFTKPQQKQSITERSSSERKSCLVGWKANSSCNKHKMTKRAKWQGDSQSRREEFQPHHRDPLRNCSGGLVGNPGRSAFCPRRGCLQLFLLLITTPHTKDVRLVRKAADSGL